MPRTEQDKQHWTSLSNIRRARSSWSCRGTAHSDKLFQSPTHAAVVAIPNTQPRFGVRTIIEISQTKRPNTDISIASAAMSARVARARSAYGSGDRASFERIREGSKRMNSCIPACFNSLGFRLLFERGIQVSVCGDLLDVFLKKSFSSQSLVLGYVNGFVCQQP